MRHVFVALLVLLVALPFFWMAYAAFLPPEIVYSGDLRSGFGVTLDNFARLAPEGFWFRLGFSLLVSFVVALLQVFTGLLAAYALWNGAPLWGVFLFTLAIPVELLMVPLFGVLFQLHLLDTPWALVLPFAASPFTVMLIYQGMRGLPYALVEAARIDGAGERRILFGIVAPVLYPALVAAGVLAFAAHWNLVLFPRVAVGERFWTLQVWIADLTRRYPADWGLLSAAALLSTLPLVLVYLLFERKIVETFEGSVKG